MHLNVRIVIRKIHMQGMLASFFIFFVLVLYAAIAFVFVIAAVRKWVWSPIAKKISPGRSGNNYRETSPPRHEETPS
jgi:hypothetical protein